MSKSNTRVCNYTRCKYGKCVDLDLDKYVCEKNKYYHEECYQNRADLQLFRTLWHDHICQTVVYSELNRILNNLVNSGFSTEFLVFALSYVISHKFKLSYPAGFKYYLNNKEIKEAFEKKKARESLNNIRFNIEKKDDSPTFKINTQKPQGFHNIIPDKK